MPVQPTPRPWQVLAADLALLVVAAVWGAGYPVSALAIRSITPLWLLGIRFAIAGTAMVLLFRRHLRGFDWRGALPVYALSLVMALSYLLHIYALTLSTAAKQSFIAGTSVAMVPFVSAAFHRCWPSRVALAGSLVTSLGLSVLAFTPGMAFNGGDVLSLLMAVTIALHVVLCAACIRKHDALAVATIQILCGGMVFLLGAVLLEPLPDLRFTPGLWRSILFLALLATVFPFGVQCVALRYTHEVHAGILLALESPFGYGVAILMGQERLRGQGLVAGAILLAGVLLAESELWRGPSRERTEPEEAEEAAEEAG